VFRLFKKAWIPLLLVVVVVLGAYVVLRVRDSFGVNANASSGDAHADDTKPFNPKHITYEVTAPSGAASASITWIKMGNHTSSNMPRCRGRTPS